MNKTKNKLLKDPRAVEPLIATLKVEDDDYVRFSVIDALDKITGKKFGKDHEKWQKWWEENKGKFLKGR